MDLLSVYTICKDAANRYKIVIKHIRYDIVMVTN